PGAADPCPADRGGGRARLRGAARVLHGRCAMIDGPLVSIIIPTFNRTQYLRTAVNSALAQTYGHIEVLIADDASSGDVRGSIADLLADPRVTYHRNPTNLGMGGNTW